MPRRSPAGRQLSLPMYSACLVLVEFVRLVAAASGFFNAFGHARASDKAPTPAAARFDVILWFDVEDSILEADDDATKRLCEMLTARGIRGTFKLVGEKARTLERRGRTDVIAATRKHDIGYLPHTVTPLLQASGDPDFPRRVTCTGTRKVSTDREITDTTHFRAEMPGGLALCIVGSTVNAVGLPEMLRGRQGTLHFTAEKDHVEFKPERIFAREHPTEAHTGFPTSGAITRHQQDFFDCIRTGAIPVAGIDLAIRVHTILCLAEMSERLGLPDSVLEKIYLKNAERILGLKPAR